MAGYGWPARHPLTKAGWWRCPCPYVGAAGGRPLRRWLARSQRGVRWFARDVLARSSVHCQLPRHLFFAILLLEDAGEMAHIRGDLFASGRRLPPGKLTAEVRPHYDVVLEIVNDHLPPGVDPQCEFRS